MFACTCLHDKSDALWLMSTGLAQRCHSAVPSTQGKQSSPEDWRQLTDRMGEVERLHSNVAKDAAAMQAMGVLCEAKALKLDMLGER